MREPMDIPFARMAASNLASVSPCSKPLRTVIKPSTFKCSTPALGQPENESGDRHPDEHANPESTRHCVTYACGFHMRTHYRTSIATAISPEGGICLNPIQRNTLRDDTTCTV